MRQVQRSPGFLGGRLLVNSGYVFWTMTAWQDEAAMNAYRTGGAHRKAMPKLLNWCDEAAVVHWTQDSPEIPEWQQAQQHMSEKGQALEGKSSVRGASVAANSRAATEPHRANPETRALAVPSNAEEPLRKIVTQVATPIIKARAGHATAQPFGKAIHEDLCRGAAFRGRVPTVVLYFSRLSASLFFIVGPRRRPRAILPLAPPAISRA